MVRRLDSLVSDLRFAIRIFRRAPGFTAVVLLSLGLGTGANAAVFTLVDAVMLRLLPVTKPEELCFLTDAPRSGSAGNSIRKVPTPFFAYKAYETIRDQTGTMSGVAAFRNIGRISVSYRGSAEIAEGQLVSGGYFSLLGVSARLGRTFNESEDVAPGVSPLAVLSYDYWLRRFGGDSSVLDQTVTINNTPFTIIGVMPPGFFGLEPGTTPEIWAPFSMKAQVTTGRDPGAQIVGRLKPGIDVTQAQAEMRVIFDRILNDRVAARAETLSPEEREEVLERTIDLSPGGRGIRNLRDEIGHPALVMMALVSLVLLIACANAATLILVKSGTRQKEFAVRISMGATRGRLIRQLIVESVLLAAAGGLLGLVLASWGVDSLLQMLASGPNPVRLSVAPDLRVTIYTTAVLGLTVVLFGLVPALRATNVEVLPALKETSPGAIGGKSRIGAGRVLVVLQVSLSLLLLVGAGLFVRTLRNIKSVDLGFIPEQALIATADATLAGYKGPRAIALYREIEERLRQLDGVRSAAACAFSPMGQVRGIAMVSVPGYAPRPGEEPVVSLNRVGAGYFNALGIPLVIGRSIDDRDGEPASKVAVINKVMADEYFQGQDPLGKTMNLRAVGGVRQVEVIGVVADSKYGKVLEEISPTVYTPFVQGAESGRMTFVLRAESDPDSLIPAVRRTIAGIDANVPVFDVKTIADQIDESLVQQRLTASLSGFFGLLALALACIGLFGVASYEVTRRTNEIGLRMALGAVPGAVLWSVMREAAILMVIGVVIGLLAALLLAPMASELLFDLEATDVVTFAAATAIMGAAALVAAYIPARRASRIDPLAAIRYE